jgi:hypothetical protein
MYKMGNNTSIIKTGEKITKMNEGSILIFKQCDFKGENIIVNLGKHPLKNIDFDNSSISSIILGPNTQLTLYQYPTFDGYSITIINDTINKEYLYACLKSRSNSFADWDWNNKISSLEIKNIRQKKLEKGTIKKIKYNAKINLGLNELLLNYGQYHHLWLNTNEKNLYIDIFPNENVRVELWTGYHIGQGRKTIVDKQRQTILKNIGIIRSIDVQNVRYLVTNNIKQNIETTDTVRQDYKPHFAIRSEKVKKRFDDYSYTKNSDKLIEVFNINNKINYQYIFPFTIILIIIKILF